MIRRYTYGTPLPTDAVVKQLNTEPGAPDCLTVSKSTDGTVLSFPLPEEAMLFGLGEQLHGINKRGHLYRSWNSDDPQHTESKSSLYASHNLLLYAGPKRSFGLFVDDPGEVVWDLGYTRMDAAVITVAGGGFDLYVITPEENEGLPLTAMCREFRGLIGRSYVPPRWAMGYLQSRWGYASEEDLVTVASGHRDKHIPLDGICMDIDYMERFKDFTWNREAFPDLPGLCECLKAQHIRVIPIIDAGVKAEEGYDVFDEGEEKGFFCKREDGKDFVTAVWPGESRLPDFFRPEVRAWFGEKYHRLLDAGAEGFWNDMNEPALFYTPEGLRRAYETVDALRGALTEYDSSFKLSGAFNALANNPEDYRSFYHTVGDKTVRHDRVHNLYGALMTKAAAEGFAAYRAEKRYLLFSRSSYIGAHRCGGIWMGDNCSWWSHILLHMKMLPSLNMAGFLYCGADLGGFTANTTEDLLERWLQLGVFTPLMRNHSAQHTREQEIYRFSIWEMMRGTLSVRYALIPYLYSELMLSALTDGLYFRPQAFDFPEARTACHVEDQLMLGTQCMIAPVYEQNAVGRHVYLPCDMLMVRFRTAEDYDMEPMAQGHHWIELKLNEFLLFIKRGCFIPLARPAEYTEAVTTERLRLLGWLNPGEKSTLRFYEDDGVTTQVSLREGVRDIAVDAGGTVQCDGSVCDTAGLVR